MAKYSIGVVTYVKRFEQYFKPLVLNLEKYFPEVEKNYVLNGFYDQDIQKNYLEKAKAFLATTSAHKVVAYNENQSLSKCWNQNILNSDRKKILILNDDVVIRRPFRWCLELQMPFHKSATINRSWSHFFISKDVIKKVGWFDERFPGVGYEDADYALCLALAEGKTDIKTHARPNIYCLGLHNIISKNDDPGWKKVSTNFNGKYATSNQEFFHRKWEVSAEPQPGFLRMAGVYYRLRPGMETPKFYDLSELT